MRILLIKPIRLYQIVFSFLPPSCRFYPTCSNYAIEVISKYGIIKGVFLSALRILRCHPLNSGGYDKVK